MATIAFPDLAKSLAITPEITYSYVFVPAKEGKATILFLHGFPSSSADWRHQIKYFSSKGYGIVAPDLLGYGESSKPDDLNAYRSEKMAAEIISVLDYEEVAKVHGIGHDFGSFMLSRVAPLYPDRILTCSFLAVPYMPPQLDKDMDVNLINTMTKRVLGYEMFGYWIFNAREDAWEILRDHVESALCLTFAEDPSLWVTDLAPIGALEKWLIADRSAPYASYMRPEDIALHRKIHQDNYKGGLHWYRAFVEGINNADLILISPYWKLHSPALFIDCKKEPLKIPGSRESMSVQFDSLVIKEIEAAHWVQLEKPDEVNMILEDFITGQ
ncbi:putative epoxide hydrolase [Cadophora sp. DSE1049]|nr:putative epoxide hydrolase [Cadophora sp. DSE1049]